MKTRPYNFVSGFAFNPPFIIFGALFMYFGIYGVFAAGDMRALILIILGAASLLTFEGIIIFHDENYVKPYTLLLGFFKIGKKHELTKYPYLSILRKTYTSDRKLGFISLGPGKPYERFELYVLSTKHTRKILVSDFDNRESADQKAEEMSHFTEMEIVKYNPRGRRR